jgi:hypothetical protein
MSEMQTAADEHPIGLILTDDLQRSRLTVFFRLLLVIPHVIVLYIWGIVACLAVIVAWLVAIFTGRVPEGLHNFIAQYLRYSTHVLGYLYLLADPWPSFSPSDPYPIDVRISGPQPQGRLGVFFRIIIAIPALILASIFRNVNGIVALLGWFYALATGRMSQGMRDLSAWLLRYEVQTYGYVGLLTSRYPSLSGAPTA